MPFNINEFVSQVSQRGVMSANKFMCTFNLPPVFSTLEDDYTTYKQMSRDIGFWIDGTSFPGVIQNTVQLHRYGYGPTETRPIVPTFNAVQMRVICDAGMVSWDLFRRWMQKVVNYDSELGIWRDSSSGQGTSETVVGQGLQAYESSYPIDYTTLVAISMYNQLGGEQKRIILTEAYPSAVSDIELAADNNDQIARFTVNMIIQDWYVDKL